MRRTLAFALAALCLIPLAGCGGGSSAGDWAEEADAICRAKRVATAPFSARLEVLSRTGFATPRERAAGASIIRQGLPRLSVEIAELRGLEPPAEDAEAAAALIGGEAEKRLIGADLAEAFEGEWGPEGERVVVALVRNEERTERISVRLGLQVCGRTGVNR